MLIKRLKREVQGRKRSWKAGEGSEKRNTRRHKMIRQEREASSESETELSIRDREF